MTQYLVTTDAISFAFVSVHSAQKIPTTYNIHDESKTWHCTVSSNTFASVAISCSCDGEL